MKEQKLFLYIVLVLLPFSAIAKTTKYFGIGKTRATLRTEKGKSEWGRFVGLGVEYSRPSFLLLAIEAAYTTKTVILENKSWPSNFGVDHSGKHIGDVPIDGSYFEIATKGGYHFQIFGKLASVKLFVGPAISTRIRYLSSFRANIHLDYDPEKGPYEFDYLRCESEGVSGTSIDSIFGVDISYKAIGVEIRYARSLTERKCLRGLTINDKLDSLYILLRYAF